MCYKIHHQLIAIEPANYYTAGNSSPEQEETIASDRSEPRRTHTNIPSSRDPSGNGTEYHLVCYTAWGVVLVTVIELRFCSNSKSDSMSFALFMVSYCTKFRVGAASYKKMLML
jgi:hypothetical protein